MSDTGGFPLVGGSPQFPGKNNVTRDGSSSNSFGWENLTAGRLSYAFGFRNKVRGVTSFAVGWGNTVSGEDGCCAFGLNNTVSGAYGSSSFGVGNTSSGIYSLTHGSQNTASGNYAVCFGSLSVASGNNSSCFGNQNRASNSHALAIGFNASAPRYSELVHSSGYIADFGDAQHGWLVFRNQSTSATPVILYLNGSTASERAVLAAGARWKCTLEIMAATTGAIDKSASWEYKFQIDRPTTAATTIIRTTPLLTLSDGSNAGAPPAGWSVAITADTTNGCPQIQVTGDTDTINWTAALHYVQSIRV